MLFADDLTFSSVEIPTGLTLQQRQLLMLRFEHETRLQHKQLELEHYKLDLNKAGKISLESGVQDKFVFNVANNLKLLPKFTEDDPMISFTYCSKGWKTLRSGLRSAPYYCSEFLQVRYWRPMFC